MKGKFALAIGIRGHPQPDGASLCFSRPRGQRALQSTKSNRRCSILHMDGKIGAAPRGDCQSNSARNPAGADVCLGHFRLGLGRATHPTWSLLRRSSFGIAQVGRTVAEGSVRTYRTCPRRVCSKVARQTSPTLPAASGSATGRERASRSAHRADQLAGITNPPPHWKAAGRS